MGKRKRDNKGERVEEKVGRVTQRQYLRGETPRERGKEWRKYRARHRGERDRGEETEGERSPWNGEKTERKRQRGRKKWRERWNGRQRDENKKTDIRRERERELFSAADTRNFRTTEFLAVLKREKLSEKIL